MAETLLKDQDNEVRQAAVVALGALRDQRAVEPLIAILKDEDVEIRQAAVVALEALGDQRAIEPLIATLKDENEGEDPISFGDIQK